jgi:hypothetical protein
MPRETFRDHHAERRLKEAQFAKRDLPKTRATTIMATSTRIRAVAEPNRLQSEPRATRLAMEEEAMRSYKDEGRSFLPIASTIDSISEKSTLKTLRTPNNVRATLLGTRSETRAGPSIARTRTRDTFSP